MKNKTCLIINFFLGDRRRMSETYQYHDRLCLVKKQIEYLDLYVNTVDKIIFNFNIEVEHYTFINPIFDILPKKINNSEISINIRENKGLSYGAWEDIVRKELKNYDYFIFLEDDYFFVQNNWNGYLIEKFNSLDECGYLAAGIKIDIKNLDKKYTYAHHSIGITSKENLQKLFELKDKLVIHSELIGYGDGMAEEIQNEWTRQFHYIGKKNYDVRNDFAVEFSLTDRPQDIQIMWGWNQDYLLRCHVSVFNYSWTWWKSWDGDQTENFIKDYYCEN
jgi:hypothetical protein